MSKDTAFTQLSNAMADAVEIAGPFIVMVDARRRFPASGVVFKDDLVLTADHVVEREEEIEIILPDGSKTSAEVAGRDPGHDLTLLRVSSSHLTPAAPSVKPAQVGQLVLALGRPSSSGVQASLGVVSTIGGAIRVVRRGRGGKGQSRHQQTEIANRYIRTDAIPYPGFSGGPLIDSHGNVLGINTSGLFRGVSIAIPVDHAWQIAQTLEKHGGIKRGYLGVRMQNVTLPESQQNSLGREQDEGLLIIWLEEGAAAQQGGLLVGDIIVGLAGNPIDSPEELQIQLTGDVVGKPAEIQILRGGLPLSISVTIGERQ